MYSANVKSEVINNIIFAIERWGNNCRKVAADYYIDDKNLFFGGEEDVKNRRDRDRISKPLRV